MFVRITVVESVPAEALPFSMALVLTGVMVSVGDIAAAL